jgi:hypothetical protein
VRARRVCARACVVCVQKKKSGGPAGEGAASDGRRWESSPVVLRSRSRTTLRPSGRLYKSRFPRGRSESMSCTNECTSAVRRVPTDRVGPRACPSTPTRVHHPTNPGMSPFRPRWRSEGGGVRTSTFLPSDPCPRRYTPKRWRSARAGTSAYESLL